MYHNSHFHLPTSAFKRLPSVVLNFPVRYALCPMRCIPLLVETVNGNFSSSYLLNF
jgi:hypothetical protein